MLKSCWSARFVALILLAGSCSGQNPESPKFYKLDFVVKEVEGAKVLNARAYSMIVSTEKSTQASSISAGSNNPGFDIGMIGVIAGIAIPNFMVAKTTATEAAAASTLRTLNTAQVTYSTIYKNRGYAPNLATLGPGTDANCQTGTATHACLLDNELGCATGAWCEKNGYRYKITALGTAIKRTDYVTVATPVDASMGKKSFCSTSDAVVRSKVGPPLSAPVTVAQCLKWEPL